MTSTFVFSKILMSYTWWPKWSSQCLGGEGRRDRAHLQWGGGQPGIHETVSMTTVSMTTNHSKILTLTSEELCGQTLLELPAISQIHHHFSISLQQSCFSVVWLEFCWHAYYDYMGSDRVEAMPCYYISNTEHQLAMDYWYMRGHHIHEEPGIVVYICSSSS